VSGYAEKCCDVYRGQAPSQTPAPAADLPDDLDRGALTAGIATIKAQVCGGKSSLRGDVSVSVKVSPAGAVTDVTVKSSPDDALSACVVAAAKRGSFAKTRRGGRFGYLWRF
jgi:TonB family protein